MQEKELIAKFKTLQDIKPNQEWVAFAKRQILQNQTPVMSQPTPGIFSNVLSLLATRKLAYAVIAVMVVFIGASGLLEYKLSNDVKVANQSAANLLALKSNIEALKADTESLKNAVASGENTATAAQKVKKAAKDLAAAVHSNPSLARQVAVQLQQNKTLLDVNGDAEAQAASIELCEAVVTPLSKDLNDNKANLTESEQTKLDEANTIRATEDCPHALEAYLLINTTDIHETQPIKDTGTNTGINAPQTQQ